LAKLLTFLKKKGLKVVAIKKLRLTKEQAKAFYIVHKDRPFYESLTDYISSGSVVAIVFEGENAIKKSA